MGDFKLVQNLYESAFNVVYRMVVRYVSLVSKRATNKVRTVTAVRELLDEYLIGPKYGPVREKLLKKYTQTHNFKWKELVLFLDCVLDDSSVKFSEYFSTIIETDRQPPFHVINLLKTVTDRCPLLQELSITIAHHRPILLLQHEPLVAKSFSQLENLTKLDLNFSRQSSSPSSDYIPFYSQLGKNCPNLIYLKLGQHFPFGNEQAVALALGDKMHFLPESVKLQMWKTHNQLSRRLRFEDQYITPLCKSLQHLEAHYTRPDYCFSYDAINLLTFVLHHFSKLEILDLNSCMDYYEDFDHYLAQAVTILHHHDSSQSSTANGIGSRLKWTVNSPPPRKYFIFSLSTDNIIKFLVLIYAESLNLRMLDSSVRQYVDVCSSKQLTAIASLCPRLKSISFKDRYIERDDVELSPVDVESLFATNFQQVINYSI